jgi:hypothetical protein
MVDHLRSRVPKLECTPPANHRKGALPAGAFNRQAPCWCTKGTKAPPHPNRKRKTKRRNRLPAAIRGTSSTTQPTSKCNTIKLPTFGRIPQPHRALASGAQFMGATGSPRYRRLLIRKSTRWMP